jgi:transcriptional regulator
MSTLYIPPTFENTNLSELYDFIGTFPFATIISNASKITVSHLPLMLQAQGEYGSLIGHMAKANQQWLDFDGATPIVCIFHGPHAYTSPSWYKTLPAVPTWNYAVVHAEAIPELITDKNELLILINDMLNHFEPSLQIAEPFKESQLDFIVGFKLKILAIQGKYKLGQNRSLADQKGIIEGLSKQNDADSTQLAEFICTHGDKT